MKLETFDDVLTSIRKNPRRQFHLLLGNGFSVSYDASIFSYNALHDFVKNLKDDDLSKILDVIRAHSGGAGVPQGRRWDYRYGFPALRTDEQAR